MNANTNLEIGADRKLSKEIAAAKALRESIAIMAGEDEETIRDTIEGETGLHEAIAGVMVLIREQEILAAGIDVILKTMSARLSRAEARISRYRAAIEQAMQIGELKSLALPEATLTLKIVPPKLEIVDEAKIPSQFWKPRDPVLDRKAVGDVLKTGIAIPGAIMGNGGVTLQIRRN